MQVFRRPDTQFSHEQIIDWLRDLRGKPFVPSSGFEATAVLRAKVGSEDTYYFGGGNVESTHLRMSMHGEEAAIAAMFTGLGRKAEIVEGWVMGAPSNLKPGDDHPLADNKASCCGKCRQQISNFAESSVPIHSVSLNGARQQTTVGEFLPNAFTFKQFVSDPEESAVVKGNVQAPTAHEVENRLMRSGGVLTRSQIFSWLKKLESVDDASKQSQAVVLQLPNNTYVAGVTIEEAAYVSIDPLQSAIAIANTAFGEKARNVKAVWSYATARDEVKLPEDAYVPLKLSGIQALAEFVRKDDNIPVHLLNSQGMQIDLPLKDGARYIPTFAQPTLDTKGLNQLP